MIRLILIVVVALFVIVGGLAVALYHFFGWKGLIAFPFILIAAIWLAKLVIGKLVKKFALGLFGMKAGALKGATMIVHSVRSVSEPPDRENESRDIESEVENAEIESDADEEDSEPDGPETPKDYVEVDVTITPRSDSCNSIWEPTELILTSDRIQSLEDLEENEVGTTHSVEIWNGSAFGPDDPGKYPGEQRLKVIFGVKPGARQAWLHYYNEPIGELKLPPGTIDV